MAAAQFFNVPELLEKVLTQLAYDALGEALYLRHFLEPLPTLAPLHRVNRLFQATITNSKTLQKAMFANTDGCSRQALAQRLGIRYSRFAAYFDMKHRKDNPSYCLEWLGVQIYGRSGRYSIGEPKTKTIDEIAYMVIVQDLRFPHDQVVANLKRLSGQKEASWRKIKVHQKKLENERISLVEVRFKTPAKINRYSRPDKDYDYQEDFSFEDGTTLGEIFDRYAEIANRTERQHIECYKKRVSNEELRYRDDSADDTMSEDELVW